MLCGCLVNERHISSSNCLAKAKTAAPQSTPAIGLALAWLLLTLWAFMPARAASFDIHTGVPTDLAISGSGYFVLRDPVTGQEYVTRVGGLCVNTGGFLVNFDGMMVQGLTDPTMTTLGDVQIYNGDGPEIVSFDIQTNGCVLVHCTDGSSLIRCQILLQNFQNPSALVQIWDNMFGWSEEDGPLPQPVAPGTSGTGALLSGCLEQLLPQVQLSSYTGPAQTFSQGILAPTGMTTDLGIQGGGFFVLRRTNDNALFATRAGGFYFDDAGYLVQYSGLRLQGYTNSALTAIGDLQVDPMGWPSSIDPTLLADDFSIDHWGVITEGLSDGTEYVRGQVLLQSCVKPDSLTRSAFDLYPIIPATGLWAPLAPPLTTNLGWIDQGFLELSQFDTNLLAVRSNLNFFVQGPLDESSVPSNLAICGNGFFTVRDPAANILYATRWGGFQLDSLGHLVTTNGLRVQGFTNSTLTQCGDITIDPAGAPNPSLTLSNYFMDSQGDIWVVLSDGSQFLRGQVLLQTYRNIQGLIPAGSGLYSNLTAAVPLFTNGLSVYLPPATIQWGALEQPSGLPAPIQLLPASGFHLLVNDLGGSAQVQSSADLAHWDTIGSVNPSDLNIAEFFDTSQAKQKFYRVVVQY